jgi:hypothetical protein
MSKHKATATCSQARFLVGPLTKKFKLDACLGYFLKSSI